jgi:mono/diheme cytochrome c family protein
MRRVVTSIDIASGTPAASRKSLSGAGLALVLAACLCSAGAAVRGAEPETGQAIYKEECARCHGPSGDGTKKTSRPLVGEKSASQLFAVIKRTMPDDDPGSCSDAEYQKVASYIHDAFYSPDAQARLHPPRVELSHLTVGQYRAAVADLIGGFRPAVKTDGRHGLHGEYFNSKDIRGDKRLIDRVDPEVNFDFGTEGPEMESDGKSDQAKFNPNQFSIQWQGSVFAAETGDYEFVVRTEQALRLWVNDLKNPVIDALVKSGQDTEYRASMFLIAGRSYSIRLQVNKGRELSDKKKGAPKPAKASVALLWKVPHHQVDELVPSRWLSPVQMPEVAVMQTPFPPDDRSYGWERGTAVSKEWVGATTDAAMDVAGYVAARLPELAGVNDDAQDRGAKLRGFCRTFAERAFRRPLSDAEKQQLVDRQFDGVPDLDLAVKRVLIRVMIAPEFLYPGSSGAPAGYATASRLALVLWDSLPDPALLKAAAEGKLSTREQIAQQARRMLEDPRARLKARQFLLAWLRVDQSPELVKDAKKFPDFDTSLAADLRTSLEMFLDDIVSSDSADFRQLMLDDDMFLNGRLAKFYGADLGPDSDFTKVKLDGQRSGVLTHPYMLATFAYPGESSPIHRGVFIIRGMLGVTLRPPANASFTPLPPEQHPDLTTRERIALQTNQESCVGCHAVINPLGFALERFDAVGRHREMENGKSIDVSGHYQTRTGSDAHFAGARELAAFLADSDEAHDAFAQQMFQQFVKQPVRAYGLEKPKELREIFAQSGYNIRKLLVEIAVIASQPR